MTTSGGEFDRTTAVADACHVVAPGRHSLKLFTGLP